MLIKLKNEHLTPSLINFFACSVASAAASAARCTHINIKYNINNSYTYPTGWGPPRRGGGDYRLRRSADPTF